MADTITPEKTGRGSGPLDIGEFGGGGILDDLKSFGGGDDGGGKPREPDRTPPPEGYRIAILLTLVGVTALFVTLVIVYVILGAQRQQLTTPFLFWVSTVVVFGCSVTLEFTRRALRARAEARFQRWLFLTLALGMVFLTTQAIGLRQLTRQGFFATVNLRSWLAFFITGTHAAHLLGGIVALIYLVVKSRYGDWTALRRRITLDSTILYWHFIDGLWLFLFAMIFLWN